MTRRHVWSRALPGFAIVIRGQFVDLEFDAEAGGFVLTGLPVSFSAGSKFTIDGGSFVLTGQGVDFKAATRFIVEPGAFVLTGQDAVFDLGFRLLAAAGEFALTGQPAVFRLAGRMVVEAGSFVLTGQAAAFKRAARFVAGAGAFALTGQDVTFNQSAAFSVLAFGKKTNEVGTTITISGIDFGAGGNVAFAFSWGESGGNNRTVSSVSINGVAATVHIQALTTGQAFNSFVASASGVSGGTGSVTVTFNASATYNGVYGVYGIGAMTLQATDSSSATATTFSDTVNVADGGCIVSAACVNQTSDAAVYNAGVDEDHKGAINPADVRTGMVGSRLYTTGATPATVSCSAGSSAARRHAVASFQP